MSAFIVTGFKCLLGVLTLTPKQIPRHWESRVNTVSTLCLELWVYLSLQIIPTRGCHHVTIIPMVLWARAHAHSTKYVQEKSSCPNTRRDNLRCVSLFKKTRSTAKLQCSKLEFWMYSHQHLKYIRLWPAFREFHTCSKTYYYKRFMRILFGVVTTQTRRCLK